MGDPLSDFKRDIDVHVKDLKNLLDNVALTPALEDHVRAAIAAHEAARSTRLADCRQAREYLDSVRRAFRDHWTDVYGDAITAGRVFQNMRGLRLLLQCKLKEDYLGVELAQRPESIFPTQLADKARLETEELAPLARLERFYGSSLTLPLEELRVDVAHAKLLLSEMQPHCPKTNGVQALVDSEDTAALGKRLAADKKLAAAMEWHDAAHEPRVLEAIDKLLKRHGRSSSSSSGAESNRRQSRSVPLARIASLARSPTSPPLNAATANRELPPPPYEGEQAKRRSASASERKSSSH